MPDGEEGASSRERAVAALAAAWPRALIAGGDGRALAEDWIDRLGECTDEDPLDAPLYPFSPSIANALFDARRARQVVRGLEGATEALDRERRGLARSAGATGPAGVGGRRISRLLVLSSDGSARFRREVARLRARHVDRLEVVTLAADEQTFGEAIFGRGRQARAVLLDHKEAVLRLLGVLLETERDA